MLCPMCATTRRSPARIAVDTLAIALALLGAACRPMTPESAPGRADDAVPTAWADATPDADGYYADPEGTWLEMLDAGPIGPLLTDVQDALDDGIDAGRLISRIAPSSGLSPSLVITDRVATTAASTATVAADDVAAALRRLAIAGSTPRIQGYAAIPLLEWTAVVTEGLTVWLLISGWTGDAGLRGAGDVARPRPAGDAIDVWRYTWSSDQWTWTAWAMPRSGYRAIRADVLQAASPAVFVSVRPRAWWPKNNAPCEDGWTSPDRSWIACYGEKGMQPIGPRAGERAGGWQPTYKARRLEVRSADGAVVHRPVDDWTGDDAIGVPSVTVLGWLDAPARLVFAEAACGESCGFNDCGDYNPRVLDLGTGRVTPVGLPGRPLALDAARARLAGMDDVARVVRIADLDTGQMRSLPMEGHSPSGRLGPVGWSEDGASLRVQELVGDCAPSSAAVIRTTRIDLATGRQTVESTVPAFPAPAPSPPGTPDPWGYADGDEWIAPLEEAQGHELLTRLQSLVDARNVDGLAALVGAADDPAARLKLRAADGQEPLAMLTPDDVRAALRSLLSAMPQNWPAVQSAARGNSDELNGEASSADVWVALSGWPVGHEAATIFMIDDAHTSPAAPPALTTTATTVWRFTPAGDAWRWTEWRLGEATYRATIEDLAQDLEGGATYPAPILAVRRTEWWPPNDAPCADVTTSPDGAWTACSGVGEGRQVGPSYMRPMRVEVRSADGATTHVALTRWEGVDIGAPSIEILGWTASPSGLLFALSGCGDGCASWLCGTEALRILTVPDGRIQPVEVDGREHLLAPDGRRLATLGPGDAGHIGLRIADLSNGAVAATALDGESGSFAWSPDGVSIAIVAQVDQCAIIDSQSAAVYRFDTSNGELTTLVPVLQHTSAWLRPDAWSDPAVLKVQVNRPEGDGRWIGIERRDTRTGALLGAATATPTAP